MDFLKEKSVKLTFNLCSDKVSRDQIGFYSCTNGPLKKGIKERIPSIQLNWLTIIQCEALIIKYEDEEQNLNNTLQPSSPASINTIIALAKINALIIAAKIKIEDCREQLELISPNSHTNGGQEEASSGKKHTFKSQGNK